MPMRVYISRDNEPSIFSPPKKLIICPQCAQNGKKEVLGEIDEQGNISVLRFHKGKTIIVSQSFQVKCTCGEVVYQKVEIHEDSHQW